MEAITDEFSRLVKGHDLMAKLDAHIEGEMDDGFRVVDDNVNALRNNNKNNSSSNANGNSQDNNSEPKTKKRASSSSSSSAKAPASNKKRKVMTATKKT